MRNRAMASFERIDEPMAHVLYPPDEKLTFEQDPRGESLSIPHQSTRIECSPNGMNRKACRRTSPGKDPGSKNRNAKRRSSIACNRCRQRKIKCSGENEEGLACTNCRTAGYTNCHFVRVNSKVLQTKAPGFPFAALGATKTESIYAQHHMDSHKSAALSNVQFVPSPGYTNYAMGAINPNPSFSRQPYNVNYECQQQQQQQQQQPIQEYNDNPIMLSSSTPQGGLDDYYGPWNNFNHNKNSAETVFPEQAASDSLTQTYPYLLLGQGATRSDIPSLVAGSLGSDRGPDTIDRTLPNPTTGAQLQTNFSSSLTSSPEALSNLSLSPEYQTDNSWEASKCVPPPTTTTHCSPMHNLTSQPFNTSPRKQARPESDMVLGFVPMPPSLSFTALDTVDTTSTAIATGDDFRIPHDVRFTRTPQNSNSRLLSIGTASAASSDCSHPDTYNYSGGGSSSSSSSNGSASESGQKQTANANCTLPLPHRSISVDVQDHQSTAAASAMWPSSDALASVKLQRTLRGY